MTVQRHYTLPNCNLTLEGLAAGDETDPMAPLTVVLNSECTFPGISETLSGGREFLNALITTVSDYAQSLLSGVPYPLPEAASEHHPVVLQPADHHRHQLVAVVSDDEGQPIHKTLVLNSVQLFDLMEAVDQLLADTQTLPDMALQLSPLHRRHARPAEPASKRIFPVAAGLSALGAAAAVLFMVPVPEFEPQRPQREEAAVSEQVDETATNLAESDTAPPNEATEEDSPLRTETAAEEDVDEDLTGAIADSAPVDPVAAGIALGRLSTAPSIDDEQVLSELEDDLTQTLEANLADDISFADALTYRVAVSEAGDIVGYKYENDAALENVDDTPLPALTFIPVNGADDEDEPVAIFLVTFDTDGEVTAEPLDPEEE
jgi:hypothetical protein